MRFFSIAMAGVALCMTTGVGCRDAGKPERAEIAENGKPADEVKQDPVQAIRTRYLKHPADVLKIVEPLTLVDPYYFKDGGTLGMLLKDANGTEHRFCLGTGRSIFDPIGVKTVDSSKNPKEIPPNAGKSGLFVGAVHFTQKNAQWVSRRGPEESALYGVLLRWVEKHPQREALYNEDINLSGQGFGNLWEIRAFFLRLDSRYTQGNLD